MEEMKQPLEQESQSLPTPMEQEDQSLPTPTELDDQSLPTSDPEPSAEPQNTTKKQSFWTKSNIIALIAGSLVLIAIAALVLVSGYRIAKALNLFGSPEPAVEQSEEADTRIDLTEIQKISSYAYTDESVADEYNAAVVASVGEHEMHGGLFQIFYWSQVYSYMTSNSYLGSNTTISLSEQSYSEELTWEQYFVAQAMDMYLQYCALYDEAVSQGITPSAEDQAALETLYDDLESIAVSYGYANADAYLQDAFGLGVTKDDYVEYYTMFAYAQTYANSLQLSIEVSEADVEAYYDANAATYEQIGVPKTDQNVVNVRHILIQPVNDVDSDGDLQMDSSSEEAWAAAEKTANEVYDTWKLDPTEDNFATVAAEYTYDTASAEAGGLYEGVYPGQMVTEFDEWCFDTSRQPGDHEIVRTSYGYHIMYFVGEGDYVYWSSVAESDYIFEQFDAMLEDIFNAATLEANYENVHVYDIFAANAAADTTTETTDE